MGTKRTDPAAVDFDDLLHGVDVLEEAVRTQDEERVTNCLSLLWDGTADTRGSTAYDLDEWLEDARSDPESVTPGQVSRLRDLLRTLAIDYKVADDIDAAKSAAERSQRNRENAKKRKLTLPAAQAEADKRWKRAKRLGERVTKQKMAHDLERDGYGAFSYLNKHLKKP